MKVGITASERGITDRQFQLVYDRLKLLNPSCIVHGGCVGGDDQVDLIADSLGIPRVVCPSTRFDKRVPDAVLKARTGSQVWIMPPKEPLVRNADIVYAVTYMLACPREMRMINRSGTWMTVRLARRELGESNVEVIYPIFPVDNPTRSR